MLRIQQYLPAKLAILITTITLCGCSPIAQTMSPPAKTAAAETQSRPAVRQAAWQPDLLVVQDGWDIDPSDHENIRKVLKSAGSEIWKHFPDQKLKPIIVYPKGGPGVLYKRGPEGEIVMKLNTHKNFWCQYSYQFSHEICHVLARYDADPHGQNWFEESVCATASLYSLRAMGKSWQTNPPYHNWKSYSQQLTAYAQDMIDQSQLPKDTTLRQWFVENAHALRPTRYAIQATEGRVRDFERAVAVQLLPMFESNPENWGAIAYLNRAKPTSRQTFTQFLQDWHDQAPRKHQKFVSDVAGKFEIRLNPKRPGTLARVH